MQLTESTSGMPAGLSIFLDKEGRDRCVVAVKGTGTGQNQYCLEPIGPRNRADSLRMSS